MLEKVLCKSFCTDTGLDEVCEKQIEINKLLGNTLVASRFR